jgi:hypothetical protein
MPEFISQGQSMTSIFCSPPIFQQQKSVLVSVKSANLTIIYANNKCESGKSRCFSILLLSEFCK